MNYTFEKLVEQKLSEFENATGWYNFSLLIDVPTGTHFEFDEEESNEDRVVVYFKQNRE